MDRAPDPIRLYRTDAHPDGWHEVIAPGGYEWWYFDAEDPRTDTQVVAILLEGFIFHPGYLRAYARFRRRPSRIAPPLPRDYCCAYLVVYRGGRIIHQFMAQYPPDAYRASSSEPKVSIGPNTLRRDASGVYHLTLLAHPWRLTGRGPRTLRDRTLAATLAFTPLDRHEPIERTFLSRMMTGADHHWVIAAPRCAVSGSVEVTRASGEVLDRIDFAGTGYHDHNFGDAPIGPGLRRWIWGRALLDTRVLTFHHAVARDASLPPETHLIESSSAGVREIELSPTDVSVEFDRRTALLLAYPSTLRFGDVLTLETPRLIDAAPFYLRVQYRARVGGVSGSALCEVAYPHRLRWPVLGRMIEMSIDRNPPWRPPIA